jgi:chromosome segregation ATPase
VLDEVDAHLDASATSGLARYIRRHSSDVLQWLIISLNHQFFSTADALVGVYKDKKTEVSGTLTLDLQQFSEA